MLPGAIQIGGIFLEKLKKDPALTFYSRHFFQTLKFKAQKSLEVRTERRLKISFRPRAPFYRPLAPLADQSACTSTLGPQRAVRSIPCVPGPHLCRADEESRGSGPAPSRCRRLAEHPRAPRGGSIATTTFHRSGFIVSQACFNIATRL